MRCRLRFWNRNSPALDCPPKCNLADRFSISFRDFLNIRIVKKAFAVLRHGKRNVGTCSKRRKGCRHDFVFLTKTQQVLLGQVRMHLDLIHRRMNPCVGEQVPNHRRAQVADSNVFHEPGIHEFLHSSPGIGVGNFHMLHRRVLGLFVEKPTRRIALFKRDIGQCNGKVNQVEIELIETEIGKRSLAGRADVIWMMKGIPELRSDPEIVTRSAIRDHIFQSFSHRNFVAVVTGTIKVAVAK